MLTGMYKKRGVIFEMGGGLRVLMLGLRVVWVKGWWIRNLGLGGFILGG